jgi:hypothetical protein
MKFLKTIIFFALIGMNFNASANFNVGQYKRFIVSEPKFKDYLVGVGRGYFWASVHTSIHWKRPIFCQPKNYELTSAEILRIIDIEIRKTKYTEDVKIEPIIAWALINEFPCK